MTKPVVIITDFCESRVADMSVIDALHKLTERYYAPAKPCTCATSASIAANCSATPGHLLI